MPDKCQLLDSLELSTDYRGCRRSLADQQKQCELPFLNQKPSELSELDGLVVRGSRIVVSLGMRDLILEGIYDEHQVLVNCSERAFQSCPE